MAQDRVIKKRAPESAPGFIQTKGRKKMQDDYSCQTPHSKSEQSDLKADDLIDLEDQKTVSESTVAEMKLRNVMSQYEMEILTTLFPKCAETLAGVLRNRPQQFEDEL